MATATTILPPKLIDQEIDGILLRKMQNRMTGDDPYALSTLCSRFGLTDDDLNERIRAIAAKKAAAAETSKRQKHPDPVDAGTVLLDATPTSVFLTFSKTLIESSLSFDSIAGGHVPLPDLRLVKIHRDPLIEPSLHDDYCAVLIELAQGRIKPGRVCAVGQQGHWHPAGRLPLVQSDNPPMSFMLDDWRFVRVPGQTKTEFSQAMKGLKETCDRRAKANALNFR